MNQTPKPLIEIKCLDCPTVFLAKSKRKKRCPECELLRRKETHKAWMESTKSNNTPRTKKPHGEDLVAIRTSTPFCAN